MVRFLLILAGFGALARRGLVQLKQKIARMANSVICYTKFCCRSEMSGRVGLLVKEGLGAQVYQHLRHDLMAGRYEPGQKLKLRDLADQAWNQRDTGAGGAGAPGVRPVSGAGRLPLGVRRGHGSRAGSTRFASCVSMLEGRGAEHAARCATPADIDRIAERSTRELVDARGRDCYPDILLANQQFHLSLCRAARMPVLLRLVETLWVQCGPLMHGMTRWPVVRPKSIRTSRSSRRCKSRDGASARGVAAARYHDVHRRPASLPDEPRRTPGMGEAIFVEAGVSGRSGCLLTDNSMGTWPTQRSSKHRAREVSVVKVGLV